MQRTALKYACALQSHMIPQADDVEELRYLRSCSVFVSYRNQGNIILIALQRPYSL